MGLQGLKWCALAHLRDNTPLSPISHAMQHNAAYLTRHKQAMQGVRQASSSLLNTDAVDDAAVMAGDGAYGSVGCALGFAHPVQAALAVAHDARRPSPLGQIRSTCGRSACMYISRVYHA